MLNKYQSKNPRQQTNDMTSSYLFCHIDLEDTRDAVHLAGMQVSNDFTCSCNSRGDGDVFLDGLSRGQHFPETWHK